MAVDHGGFGGAAAAVDGGAVRDFDLDGGVVDAEVIAELVVDALEDGFAFGKRHFNDLDMARERV